MPTLAIDKLEWRARGFTLIELMIAMTLGLITIAGVGFVYLGSAQAYRTQDATSRMQEGARYAFELIAKDLRMAGNAGCAYNPPAIKVLNTNAWYGQLFDQPVSAVDKDGAAGETEYSDALRILRADTDLEYRVTAYNSGGSQFTVAASSGLLTGQLMVANDCKHAAVFQASSVNTTTNLINHLTTGTPGNSVANLGELGAVYPYAAGTRLYRLQALSYFVKMNPAGVPALYRSFPTPPNATLVAEELVEGVQDLQVSFAVDTTTPMADGVPDFVATNPYLTATQVLAGTTVPESTDAKKWGRVVSVRISLLMRSVENNVGPKAQTYRFNGATVTPTDRYIRKVFTHVIDLRNR